MLTKWGCDHSAGNPSYSLEVWQLDIAIDGEVKLERLAYALWNSFCLLIFADCLGLAHRQQHLGWHLLTLHVLEADSCGTFRARTVLFSAFVICILTKATTRAPFVRLHVTKAANSTGLAVNVPQLSEVVIQGATSLPTGRSPAINCVHHALSVTKSMHR